jgi:PAS domain S-box-containing protein
VIPTLLLRQIRKRLNLSAQQAPQLGSLSLPELAKVLRDGPPESLAQLLEDVAATYQEADDGRRRLSHALRLSSDELFEANRCLEQRAAEQATQLALLNSTLDSTPDGVLVVDRNGRTLLANRQFMAMWRIDAQGLVSEVLQSERLERLMNQLPDPEAFRRRVLELSSSTEEQAFEVLEFNDGRVFDRFTQPIRVAGKPVARIWVFRDVTMQRQAERERSKLEEQLRQSQRMEAIGKLAGGVAHDFNNLLMAIIGYSEVLTQRLYVGDPIWNDVSEIVNAAERAADLTRQLLAFSRKQVMQPKVLDLNQVVANLEKMLRRLIGAHIELVTVCGATVGHVKADPGQIEQVVLNLVVNARDAMPRGGKLIVQTSNVVLDSDRSRRLLDVAPGDYVALSVQDTGIGIDEEIRQHIFEPFFTTKELGKGTGLGLSTVYGVVKQSGGHLQVESEPGKGTTFTIYLPRVEPEPQPVHASPTHSTEPGGEVLLLVEDEALVRRPLAEMLTVEGYEVLSASNGPEALELSKSRAGPIDVLITDVVLPGMNGSALAERICSARPETRVLFISGYIDEVTFRQSVLGPRSAFLQKPFKAAAVSRKVRELLERGLWSERPPAR